MSRLGLLAAAVAALVVVTIAPAPAPATPPQWVRSTVPAVSAVLDELHDAASKADGERYSSLFSPGAVFLGTDATERWTIEEFRAYAMERFAAGTGWTYTVLERHVTFSKGGSTAWFDERLSNEKYGECRGTGVLVKTGAGWRIAQYNLTIPIPNEIALDVVSMIRQSGESGR